MKIVPKPKLVQLFQISVQIISSVKMNDTMRTLEEGSDIKPNNTIRMLKECWTIKLIKKIITLEEGCSIGMVEPIRIIKKGNFYWTEWSNYNDCGM